MSAIKHTYSDMIQDALVTLAERKGSSRQAIWKYISTKFPESEYKQYLIRLKKIDPHHVLHVKGRFKLTQGARKLLLKNL